MKRAHSFGFTLIEIMVTLALAIVILSVGVPSFQSMIKDNRKVTAINDLRGALALARSTAITQRQRVTVCKSADNSSCTDDGDWSQGWIVFADPNDPAGTRDNTETILRVHDALPGSGTFSGNGNVANRVSFSAQGLSSGTLGTLTYTDGSGYTGALIVSFGGQVRYEDRSYETSSTGG